MGNVINKIIKILLIKNPKGVQIKSGRSFLSKEFKPQHLLLNYKLFKDKVSNFYLSQKMNVKNIKLIKLV